MQTTPARPVRFDLVKLRRDQDSGFRWVAQTRKKSWLRVVGHDAEGALLFDDDAPASLWFEVRLVPQDELPQLLHDRGWFFVPADAVKELN